MNLVTVNWLGFHYFRVYLMQRYIQQHNEVELSALGMGRLLKLQPFDFLYFYFYNLSHFVFLSMCVLNTTFWYVDWLIVHMQRSQQWLLSQKFWRTMDLQQRKVRLNVDSSWNIVSSFFFIFSWKMSFV